LATEFLKLVTKLSVQMLHETLRLRILGRGSIVEPAVANEHALLAGSSGLARRVLARPQHVLSSFPRRIPMARRLSELSVVMYVIAALMGVLRARVK